MCGITGFWNKELNNKEKIKKNINKMTDSITHRGPDDRGIFIDNGVSLALGFRRLAIIDLSETGKQPMFSHSKNHIIVFNGEIYNYIELKNELENEFDIQFKGTSDTEVLLEALEYWGIEKTLKKLNGMFDFALWNIKEKKLFLARDRLGIKPLYWGIQGNVLLFGSELKTIISNEFFKPILNQDAIQYFFQYKYIPAPLSIYENIYKLEPGHYLIIDEKFKPNIRKYWDIREITEKNLKSNRLKNDKEYLNELEQLLLKSVKLRMIADVPLGAFLSGGIDSTTVVALMQAQSNKKIKTFTIGFEEKGFNEAEYAKKIAKHLGTEHTELYVSSKNSLDVIPQLSFIYDEPFADSSQIPTYLISKLTRQYVTVSLSGDGGDELFLGYNRYFKSQKFYKIFSRYPHVFRQIIANLIHLFPVKMWEILGDCIFLFSPSHRIERFGDRVKKGALLFNFREDLEFYCNFVWISNNPNHLLNFNTKNRCDFREKYSQLNIKNFMEKIAFIDLVHYLPDDILTKVDRASMAVSLEARVPILDHHIVEFAKTIPFHLKVKDGKGKWILREILKKYVPENLFERPKMGFGVPIGIWLKGPLKDWAEELISDKNLSDGILNKSVVKKIWKEHQIGKRDWKYLLWNILMFQAWKEKWM